MITGLKKNEKSYNIKQTNNALVWCGLPAIDDKF